MRDRQRLKKRFCLALVAPGKPSAYQCRDDKTGGRCFTRKPYRATSAMSICEPHLIRAKSATSAALNVCSRLIVSPTAKLVPSHRDAAVAHSRRLPTHGRGAALNLRAQARPTGTLRIRCADMLPKMACPSSVGVAGRQRGQGGAELVALPLRTMLQPLSQRPPPLTTTLAAGLGDRRRRPFVETREVKHTCS